jgi:hypothetical protein
MTYGVWAVGDPELGYRGRYRAEPTPESPETASSGAGDPDADGRCLGSWPTLRITKSGECEGRTDLV